MVNQSKADLVRQVSAAIALAEKKMREALKKGDVEAYHSYQVQWNHLQFKLNAVKRGEYDKS